MKKFLSILFAAALCVSAMMFTVVSAETANQKADPQKGDTVAVLHTNYGDIAMSFFADAAPKGVENFITLAKDGKYDNTIFHRVVEDFMIQGGDYTNSDGTGGESCWGEDFELECVDYLSNIRGSVAYANRGENTNSSQFYINSKDNSSALDGSYTVFGQVFSGMEVVDLISACEKSLSSSGELSVPVNQVKLESVEITKYSSGLTDSLAAATDPYEGVKATDGTDAPAEKADSSAGGSDDDEPFNFIPIIVAVGVIAVIFASFAIPYGISDRKKKKARAEAKARMKSAPDYKKKKSKKKR